MGIFDKLRGQLIDIIEYTEPSENDILAWRFPRAGNEIKMGAKLIVREGQNAVFVNEGQLADIYKPGTYTLSTQNMPILSDLKGWKYGFESPFKAEVYFISLRQWTDQKWGTPNPIMMRDPEFGPVRIRAFGSYAFHVSDPAAFLRQLVITDPSFETYEISNHLRNSIISRFADCLAQAKLAVLDMAGNYDKISKIACEAIKPDLATLGLALTSFYIENISLPQEVEQALDKRTQMGVLGDLNRYTQYQTAEAIGDAAKNPSGVAGMGVGFGAGAALGQQMAGAMAGSQAPQTVAPPPLPGGAQYYIAINNQQAGPFTLDVLKAHLADGTLKRDSLVWKQGMPQWAAAESIGDLQQLFTTVPPPLPK